MAKIETKTYPQCPDYDGIAICVDATPLKEMRDKQTGEPFSTFRYVFEVPLKDDTVSTNGLTLKWGDRAKLKQLLVEWMGFTMTSAQVKEWDNEERVGKCAIIKVRPGQPKEDGSVYSEIRFVEKTDKVIEPSGKYVRVKDRKQGNDTQHNRTPQFTEAATEDVMRYKMHCGPYKDIEFADMSAEQLQKCCDVWLPVAKSKPKLSADERRTKAALEHWLADKEKQTAPDSDANWNG